MKEVSAAALVCLLVVGTVAQLPASSGRPVSHEGSAREGFTDRDTLDVYRSIGGYFTENRGQVAEGIRYYSGGNPAVAFRDDRVMLVLNDIVHDSAAGRPERGWATHPLSSAVTDRSGWRSLAILVKFDGANAVVPVGRGELPFHSNFFKGNDSTRWQTDVRNYREVVYKGMYDGVDLVYRATEKGVKYDLIVAPGADISAIKMSYEGARSIELDAAGGLVVKTAMGDIGDSSPVAYQGGDDVGCSFVLVAPLSYGFRCTGVDRSREVVIDPLLYSTFLGGSDWDEGYSIKVDSAGSAYVTGRTQSMDFPVTPGAFDVAFNGGSIDAFVVKLDPTGGSLLYSTYLGGGDMDIGTSITIDQVGSVYVTGYTESTDFPVSPGAFDATLGGFADGFVARLDSKGSLLLYSTYLGGAGTDEGFSIARDSAGGVCVTGYTDSIDFPVAPGAVDMTFNGMTDAFVTRLDLTTGLLSYSTYLGGGNNDYGYSIAVRSFDNMYVTGRTQSSDFPVTPGALDVTFSGVSDAFVARLRLNSSSLIYSTYIDSATGYSIATDFAGNAYVTGTAGAPDFPVTPGAYQTTFGGNGGDVFVLRLNSAGSSLLYSTFVGGSDLEEGYSVAIDSSGNAYVTGYTESFDFPVTPGAFDTSFHGAVDAFVSKLDSTGSSLLYSTYLSGAPGGAGGYGIAADSAGDAYVTGRTQSRNFPVTPGAFDTTYNGMEDAFVAKLEPTAANSPPIASNLGVQGFTAPPGITHITDPAPQLNWTYSDPDGDFQMLYDVRIGTASGSADMWDPPATPGPATVVTYGGPPLVRGMDYYFGVKVSDNNLSWSTEAEVGFHMNSIPNPPMAPVTPAESSTVPASPSQTVSWTSGGDNESDIITYEWQASADTTFTTILAEGTTTGTASTTFGTNPSSSYFWRVRARDDYEPTTWSAYGNAPPDYWTFNTSAPSNTPPMLAIISPSGGEVWFQGSSHGVTWITSDAEDVPSSLLVWINYSSSAGGGKICGPIRGDSGPCVWIIPAITATDVVVNGTVVDTGGLKGYGESGQFTIRAPSNTPPAITVSSPSGGEVWTQGSTHTVTWTASDVEDSPSALLVWVNYTSSAGSGTICGHAAGNVGSCSWTLPMITATDVVVNGTVVDTGGLKGYDDTGPLAIRPPPNTPPSVTLQSPVGGETWLKASVHSVNWTMHDDQDVDANLTIYVNYTTGGVTRSIAAALKGQTSFAWTLPDIEADDVVVNITVIDSGGLKGWSQSGPFTIKALPPPPPPSSDILAQYWWLIVIIVAVTVVLLVIFFLKRRKPAEDEAPPPGQQDQPLRA